MEMQVIFKKCKEDNVVIHPHCNSRFCSQKIIEIDPAVGCEFQCQYCCVYTQEEECQFNKVVIYEDYDKLLEKFIIENKERLKYLTFFYSFESDCFQRPLIESGMTEKILNLLKKYNLKYFLLTKGGIPPENIRKLLLDTKENVQILVNDTMPNEEIRGRVEPKTATIEERFNLVKYCLDNGILVTISFSPILPFIGLEYLKEKILQYSKMGIVHFRLDMLEMSEESLSRIKELLPEYSDKIDALYLVEDRVKNKWIAPKSKNEVMRYKPSAKLIADMYKELDSYIYELDKNITVSICDGVVGTNIYLSDFNKRSYKNGFNCMGVKFK